MAPNHKVTWPFDPMVFPNHVTNKNHYIFTITVPITTKFSRWWLTLSLLLPLITRSCEIMWQTKNISTTTEPIATKHGRMVTYLEWFLPIKPHDPLITWSSEITWQISNTLVPMPMLGPTNLAGWWFNVKDSYL